MIAFARAQIHCDAPCTPVDQGAFLVASRPERLLDADHALRSAGS